ncbi:MAG: hypothetical protein IPK06_05135 [Ignavibacteriae bacterium]|nr:hypothetical protein [Ignavibacteriota bacterium]
MTPKNIRTKARVFNVFADAVIDWYNSPNKSSQNFYEWSKSALNYPSVQKYIFYRDSVFINYNGGSFTLAEFEKSFFMNNIAKEFNTKIEFKKHLNFLVGQSMRDYFLEKEAEEKNYDETPWFEHEYMKWTSKFAFEELMQKYNDEKLPNDKNLKEIINDDLAQLKSKYNIYVNYAMLDTLKVDETAKAKGISIQLMKLGVNRLAEPIVDGYWKSLTN